LAQVFGVHCGACQFIPIMVSDGTKTVLATIGGVALLREACKLLLMFLRARQRQTQCPASLRDRLYPEHGLGDHIMDVDGFREAGRKMVEWIADYRASCHTRSVLPTVQPGFLSDRLPAFAPAVGAPWETIFRDFEEQILPGITHWESPHFFSYFKPHASFPSVLGEFLCAGLNVIGFSWIASPACTELEMVVCDWFAKMLRLPEDFLCRGNGLGGGVIQGTAGESAIVALLAAVAEQRQKPGFSIEKAVVYGSDQAHSILDKACLVVGIPSHHLRKISTNFKQGYALQPDALEKAIVEDEAAGLQPLFLFVTVGTTSTTASDVLPPLTAVAQKKGLWVHLDAAYGGAYAICPEFRNGLFDGMENVDSVVVNAHKKLMANFDVSLLWTRRRRALLQALSLEAEKNEYLRNANSDKGIVIDYKDWQLPLGRRFRSLKLWFVLRSFGAEGLREHIRNGVRLAATFSSWVKEDDRFEVCCPSQFALVCIRLRAGDEASERLKDACNNSGKIHFVSTKVEGQTVLRIAIGGLEMSERDIAFAWKVLQEEATRVLV